MPRVLDIPFAKLSLRALAQLERLTECTATAVEVGMWRTAAEEYAARSRWPLRYVLLFREEAYGRGALSPEARASCPSFDRSLVRRFRTACD
jgi:hypothetical protein